MLIKIGTRGSKLALIQTREIEALLKEKYPEGCFIKHLLSRKLQIVPEIEKEVNDKNN